MRTLSCCLSLIVILVAPQATSAQDYIISSPVTTVYSPVISQFVYRAPVVVQRPFRVANSPVIEQTGLPPATVVESPPVVVAKPAPAFIEYQPVITTYRPLVRTYRPIVTYAPYGRQVVVRQKVYVRGQPVRNFFRAITP